MEIKTLNGYSSFSGIKRELVTDWLEIKLKNGQCIKCTKDHKIYKEEDLPIWADLLSEGEFILTENRTRRNYRNYRT